MLLTNLRKSKEVYANPPTFAAELERQPTGWNWARLNAVRAAWLKIETPLFDPSIPLILRKPSAFAVDDLPGVWRIHWQIDRWTILSSFYTRHDQACLLWGLVSASIFVVAQFLPLSWTTQVLWASGFTLVGIIGMVLLTWQFSRAEGISWILLSWVVLMGLGALVTDLGVFLAWGEILIRICPLWLGLCGIGYLLTGVGMRSRTFLLAGVLHLLAIWFLPYVGPWQPLTTGLIISGSVVLIAELQWDSSGVCARHRRATSPDRPEDAATLPPLEPG